MQKKLKVSMNVEIYTDEIIDFIKCAVENRLEAGTRHLDWEDIRSATKAEMKQILNRDLHESHGTKED